MLRTFCRTLGLLVMGLALPLLLQATPASALTYKQKMETCRIGAKAEKLTGAKRTAFIRHCMAKGKPLKRAHHLTSKAKMETCKAGARDLKYTGAKRTAFIKRCMARGNYEPPVRRALKKHTMKKPVMKKTTTKKKN
ncbi:MAG: PsiF family protein [Pseudolabrys sp.]